MNAPAHVIEVFLRPGEFYFGEHNTRIRTLLGSCVSIIVWHPLRRIGGMCHYMLPSRGGRRTGPLDGRYAEDAVELFLQAMRARGTHPSEYQVKLVGGGNMFVHAAPGQAVTVADRNIEAGRRLLRRHGFRVHAEAVGEAGHRQIIFELWNGHVWVRRTPLTVPRIAVA